MASSYQSAAQAYSNAAAQCSNPAGAACMRQNAQYYTCLANSLESGGGNCGAAPSCSTSCSSGATNEGYSPGYQGTPGPLSRGQAIQSIGNSLVSIFGAIAARNAANSAQNAVDVDPGAQAAADAAAAAAAAQQRQQQINSDAADLLQQSNEVMASLNGTPSSGAVPDATTTVSSLLDPPSTSSGDTVTVTALLDGTGNASAMTIIADSQQSGGGVISTVTSLLDDDQSTVSGVAPNSTSATDNAQPGSASPDGTTGASSSTSTISSLLDPNSSGDSSANAVPQAASPSAGPQDAPASGSNGDGTPSTNSAALMTAPEAVSLAQKAAQVAEVAGVTDTPLAEPLKDVSDGFNTYQAYLYGEKLVDGQNLSVAENAAGLAKFGSQATSASPAASWLIGKNVPAAGAVGGGALAVLNNTLEATNANDNTYNQDTDAQNVPYIAATMIPGYSPTLWLKNKLDSAVSDVNSGRQLWCKYFWGGSTLPPECHD